MRNWQKIVIRNFITKLIFCLYGIFLQNNERIDYKI